MCLDRVLEFRGRDLGLEFHGSKLVLHDRELAFHDKELLFHDRELDSYDKELDLDNMVKDYHRNGLG